MKRVLIFTLIVMISICTVSSASEWSNDDSTIRASVTYKDIDSSFWGYDAIYTATRYGWFAGYTDGQFKPNDVIKRSEAAKAISNFIKLDTVAPIVSSYSDVDTQSWYSSYVEAAGYLFYPTCGSEFRPSLSITRQDAMYLLVNAYKYNTLIGRVDDDILNEFTDVGSFSSDILGSAKVAVYYGIVAGFSDYTIRPGAELTRAQFATLLYRLYSIGPNMVTTDADADYIDLTTGYEMTVPLNGRKEVTAEIVFSDGKRMDFTNNLNIYTTDNDVLKVVDNRIYGVKKGVGTLILNNLALSQRFITVTVE